MSKSGTTWSFTYDADGMRTQRTSGSTTYSYVYNGSQLSYMGVGSDSFYFSYDASGTPVSVKYNNTTYYYATNLQGDVTAILNSSGTAVVTYTYDAWGNVTTTANSAYTTLAERNPLKYRGYVHDQETGLYYLHSRYYNPNVGRFLCSDALVSTGQGLLGNNMFAYCRNNPVSRSDASGTEDVSASHIDDNNPLNDLGRSPSGGSSGVADVSSSFYARQNVKVYDAWWRNSPYNPNMTWSNGATSQETTNGDAFDSFVENPKSIKGKTESEISDALGETWTQGKYGSKGQGWKFIKGDKMIAYHPGGGRHVGSYYVFSSATIGRIKLVGSDYVPSAYDKAIIIWDS